MEFFYDGLRLVVPNSVYRPAEDSFMLAEAAKSLKGNILEIGCGSGMVSLICAKNEANEVVGVDITQDAVRCATENAARNKISNVHFLRSNLFLKVPKDEFDAIVFNPPYLPTEGGERLPGALNHAFDGGKDGRQVLDRFLNQFDPYLKPEGTLLLVQSSLNDTHRTLTNLEGMAYTTLIVAKESFFFETVYLIKALKAPKP